MSTKKLMTQSERKSNQKTIEFQNKTLKTQKS